jgi:hypothetical protein
MLIPRRPTAIDPCAARRYGLEHKRHCAGRSGRSALQDLDLSTTSRAQGAPPQSFAALRIRAYRMYLLGNAFAMAADSTEHVITIGAFQKFQSPRLRASP